MPAARSTVVFVRIMRGEEWLFDLPVEVTQPSHLSDGVRDALEMFRAQHPQVSLLDDDIRITFVKDDSGV